MHQREPSECHQLLHRRPLEVRLICSRSDVSFWVAIPVVRRAALDRLLLHSGAHVYLNKRPAGKDFPRALLSLKRSNLSEAIPCRSFHKRAISKTAFRRICVQTANSRRLLPRSLAERRIFHCRACEAYACRPILEAIACRSGTLMGAVTTAA
jgi:hypothetical protein